MEVHCNVERWCATPCHLTKNRNNFNFEIRQDKNNPLHPNIGMYIIHTVYTFLKVLTRRICLPIKSFFRWWSLPLFS